MSGTRSKQRQKIFFFWVLRACVFAVAAFISLKYTTATNGSLIYTASPAMIVLLEAALKKEWPGIKKVIGLILAFSGVALVVLEGDFTKFSQFHLNLGDIGILIASVAWAVYSLRMRSKKVGRLSSNVLFVATASAGLLFLLPMMLSETIEGKGIPTSVQSWASIAALSLIPSILAYTSYQYTIRQVGPSVTSYFLYLMPLSAIGLSILFLGERPHLYHMTGLILVLSGIILATQKRV
jgi:drug/metabolite transporter (DMT)-like permease